MISSPNHTPLYLSFVPYLLKTHSPQKVAKRKPRRRGRFIFWERLVCCKSTSYVQYKKYKKTLVSRTQRTQISSDGLEGHGFKVRLVALQNDEVAFRKSRLTTDPKLFRTQTAWSHDMNLNHEKICSMVKKVADNWSHQWLFASSVPCSFYKIKIKSNRLKHILHLTPTDPPNPEKDDGNHKPRGTDKWLERNGHNRFQTALGKMRESLANLFILFIRKGCWRSPSLNWENSWSFVVKAIVLEKLQGWHRW